MDAGEHDGYYERRTFRALQLPDAWRAALEWMEAGERWLHVYDAHYEAIDGDALIVLYVGIDEAEVCDAR